MSDSEHKRINPFYVILVLFGVAFVVTAFAYFLMALKDVHASGLFPATGSLEAQAAGSLGFVEWMDRYGVRLMVGELVVLAISTVAAIVTDTYWSGDQASEINAKPADVE